MTARRRPLDPSVSRFVSSSPYSECRSVTDRPPGAGVHPRPADGTGDGAPLLGDLEPPPPPPGAEQMPPPPPPGEEQAPPPPPPEETSVLSAEAVVPTMQA